MLAYQKAQDQALLTVHKATTANANSLVSSGSAGWH